MAKDNVPQDQARERTTVLVLLIGYGGFVAGTILIPISSTLGGIIFWLGVFIVFWGGFLSGKKK